MNFHFLIYETEPWNILEKSYMVRRPIDKFEWVRLVSSHSAVEQLMNSFVESSDNTLFSATLYSTDDVLHFLLLPPWT